MLVSLRVSIRLPDMKCMQGSELDTYAKQWRLFADIFNNVGTMRHICDLLHPH